MKHCETLLDEAGVELLVSYEREQIRESIHEDYPTELMTYTELYSIEVVIAGKGIDILPFMTEKQKLAIIENLNENL